MTYLVKMKNFSSFYNKIFLDDMNTSYLRNKKNLAYVSVVTNE